MEVNITRKGLDSRDRQKNTLEQVRVTTTIRGICKICIELSGYKPSTRILTKIEIFRTDISKHFGKHLKGQKKGSR